MQTDSDFDGRVAVVTGAGSGIGRAGAELFAQQGAAVAVVDRQGDRAQDVATSLKARGLEALAVECDVAVEEETEAMATTVMGAFGRIDCVVANAGIHKFGTVLSTTVEDWDEIIAVDLRGAFLTIRACLPIMIKQRSGAIVVTSSDCAIRTSPEAAAYTAAKHGVIGLAQSIAVDFGAEGIRSNVIVPGVTDTPGLKSWYSVGDRTPEAGMKSAATLSPLGRVGRPEEVAQAMTFLCSDRASFITGATILVEGGMTITYGAD